MQSDSNWILDTGSEGGVIYSAGGGVVATIPIDLNTWKGNAKLLLSAPALLRELESLVIDLETLYGWPESDLRDARFAIAAAKGLL